MRDVKAVLWVGMAILVISGCAKRVATVKEQVPHVQEERVTERPAPSVAQAPVPAPPSGPPKALPAPKRPTVVEEGLAGGPPPQEVAKREPATSGATAGVTTNVTGNSQTAPAQPAFHDAFFDFDRAIIRDDAKAPLAANAKRLTADPGLTVLVEGHTDERGSADYNLVLGEKRAKAVKEYLMALGVDAGRIQTVSYGKERPFCREQTEDCYQQNRQGHMVIPAR